MTAGRFNRARARREKREAFQEATRALARWSPDASCAACGHYAHDHHEVHLHCRVVSGAPSGRGMRCPCPGLRFDELRRQKL